MKTQFNFTAFLFTVLFLLSSKLAVYSQWQPTGSEIPSNINGLVEKDGRLIIGSDSGVYYSDDNGDNWQRSPSFPWNMAVFAVLAHQDTISAFATPDRGFLDYRQLFFYQSTDGGITWSETADLGFSDRIGNWFVNEELFVHQGGLIADIPIGFVYSVDNGKNWETLKTPPVDSLTGWRFFFDETGIYVDNYFRGVRKSYDFGETWQVLSDSFAQGTHYHLHMNGVLIGSKYDYQDSVWLDIYSLDYGESWTLLPTPNDTINYGFSFYGTTGDSIVAWNDGLFYLSDDFGQTWALFPPLDNLGDWPHLQENGYTYRRYPNGITRFNPQTEEWERKNKGIQAAFIRTLRSDGNDLYAGGFGGGLHISRDHGQTFELVNDSLYFGGLGHVTQDRYFVRESSFWYAIHRDGSNRVDSLLWTHDFQGFSDDYYYGYQKFDSVANLINIKTLEKYTIYLPKKVQPFVETELFIKGQTLYFYISNGAGRYAWHSEDFGQTWTNGFVNVPGGDCRIWRFGDKLLHLMRFEHRWSYDFGKTWQPPIYSDLVNWNRRVDEVQQIYLSDSLLLAVLDFGVLASRDGGENWQSFRGDLPTLYQRTFINHRGNLFLGTYSAGLWTRNLQFLTAKGLVYLDWDGNSQYSNTDAPLPNTAITTKEVQLWTHTDSLGQFDALIASQGDTIFPLLTSPHASATPPYYALDSLSPRDSLRFAVQIPPNISDFRVEITSKGFFNRGFENQMEIDLTNVGSIIQAGTFRLGLDPKLDFMEANPAPKTIQGDTLYWDLDSLGVLQSLKIQLRARTAALVDIGDTVSITGIVVPENQDIVPSDNRAVLIEPIVGSYDPNDKQVFPSGFIPPEAIRNGERLTYTIRFQNTGNFPATFVRILDTLSSKYDLSTFRMHGSSHEMTWSLENRVLECMFRAINLPDSSADWIGSQGFVKFSIEPQRNLGIDEKISNRAAIYFDYNAPIITNFAENIIQNPIIETPPDTTSAPPILDINVFPNPTNAWVRAEWKKGTISQLTLTDAQGRTLSKWSLDERQDHLAIDLRAWERDVVFFVFEKGDKRTVRQVVNLYK